MWSTVSFDTFTSSTDMERETPGETLLKDLPILITGLLYVITTIDIQGVPNLIVLIQGYSTLVGTFALPVSEGTGFRPVLFEGKAKTGTNKSSIDNVGLGQPG